MTEHGGDRAEKQELTVRGREQQEISRLGDPVTGE
jgi:hypothetical protein